MINNRPIGIFDSGLGGLSVLQQVCECVPNKDIIYVADRAHTPYGCKDIPFVEQRSRVITERLIEQGAELIVIACNTATASIIDQFRQDYGIPFVGVEPGIKPAQRLSQNGKAGVLATTATIASERYQQLVQRFENQLEVYSQPCPGLAEQVEQGFIDTDETKALLQQYLQPLLAEGIDTLVLGCTHYSFLSAVIKQFLDREIVDREITIVDTSRAVAEQVKRLLVQTKDHSLMNTQSIRYLSTGSVLETKTAIKILLGQEVSVDVF